MERPTAWLRMTRGSCSAKQGQKRDYFLFGQGEPRRQRPSRSIGSSSSSSSSSNNINNNSDDNDDENKVLRKYPRPDSKALRLKPYDKEWMPCNKHEEFALVRHTDGKYYPATVQEVKLAKHARHAVIKFTWLDDQETWN